MIRRAPAAAARRLAPVALHAAIAWLPLACGTATSATSATPATLATLATPAAAAAQDTAPARPAPAPPAPADPPTLPVNGLLNSGFEWIADGTSDPRKYGAYWLGAFAPREGDATCFVGDDRPWRGAKALRLAHTTGEVRQKIVADPRFTGRLVVTGAVRTARGGWLLLTLQDGPGRTTSVRITSDETGLAVTDAAGGAVALLAAAATPREEGNDGWHRLSFDVGALFAKEHGTAPAPRLLLRLECGGPNRAMVDVDELTLAVPWPAVEPAALRRWIGDLVRWTLDAWYLPASRGGLQLVDPATGYATGASFDVITGARGEPERTAGLHTIHTLLLRWLQEARRQGRAEETARWQPELRRITATLLAHNFDPATGLPRIVTVPDLLPVDDAAVTIDSYVEFLLEAREVVGDADLSAACLGQARRIADTLLQLQRSHDIPAERAPRLPVWDARAGRIAGDTSNWFGFLPDRLTPQGGIETDKRFYTSWAILTGRTFWYEFMSSPRAILRVHEVAPGAGDLAGVQRAVSRFHRDWDASRYDLENDTDDHYGHLCTDLLDALRHVGPEIPDALALVQEATDHRLPRDAASADDTLWVQAARLGTACAGDSPRAFLGPLGLHELPPEANPLSSGLPLYRDALLELAQNDLKGRQLTNAQFTESFFKDWEMVCICYRGTYQGDCREQPADWWQGDVGDTFGGPPTSAIDAQAAAFRVAPPARRPQILAALELIRNATDSTLQRPYGYLFGLDEAVARQYELPARYTIGLSSGSSAGLGYVMAWMRLLPHLGDDPAARPLRARLVAAGAPAPDGERAADGAPRAEDGLAITGPAGGIVAVPAAAVAFPAPVSDRDGRMLALDVAELPGGLADARRVTLDAAGQAFLRRADLPPDAVVAQPVLLDPATGQAIAIGEPVGLSGDEHP